MCGIHTKIYSKEGIYMKNKQFKVIGNYLIQIGLYLNTVDFSEFEERTEIKNNINNFLLQSYVYLNSAQETTIPLTNKTDVSEESYLTRQEVLEMYHPLFTPYGLSQLVHTKKFPYLKRGNKYFFKKTEIDEWIKKNQNQNQEQSTNNRIKYV